MNTEIDVALPFVFTDSAANKVKELIEEEGNPELKLRVFVTGGGCSGFQYGFTFDEVANDDDTTMQKNGVTLLVDPMSYQYLVGAEIDYTEGLEGSQFVIKNPNATSTCGCGSSFSAGFAEGLLIIKKAAVAAFFFVSRIHSMEATVICRAISRWLRLGSIAFLKVAIWLVSSGSDAGRLIAIGLTCWPLIRNS